MVLERPRRALDRLPNKIMATKYKLALLDEVVLIAEIEKTQRAIQERASSRDDAKIRQKDGFIRRKRAPKVFQA